LRNAYKIQYGGTIHIAMPAPASRPSAKTVAPTITLDIDMPLGRGLTMPARITSGGPRCALPLGKCGPTGPTIAELQATGARSLRAIAAGLNERGIQTPRGVGEWKAGTVAQLLAKMPN
jgi:Recombinase